jgi:hypothetical protein
LVILLFQGSPRFGGPEGLSHGEASLDQAGKLVAESANAGKASAYVAITVEFGRTAAKASHHSTAVAHVMLAPKLPMLFFPT